MSNDSTAIIMEMNGTEVKATLNSTKTAQALLEMLPYSVSVSRAPDDLCGGVSETLPSDPAEGKNSWKVGEIGWFGGWFTILVDHEEKFTNMPGIMVIGQVEPDYLDTVASFRGRVDITVKLAD